MKLQRQIIQTPLLEDKTVQWIFFDIPISPFKSELNIVLLRL